MGKLSKDLYLDNVRRKYKKARKKEKSEIIAEVYAISGFHQKHAIRMLNKDHRRMIIKKEARGRRKSLSRTSIFGTIKTNLASHKSIMQ